LVTKNCIGIIGSSLFDDLLNKVNNQSGTPITTADALLLDKYIAPVLVSGVDMEIIDVLIFKSKNKGVVKLSGEEIVPVTQNERVTLIDKFRNYYTVYVNNLIAFLEKNYKDYPEYDKCTTDGRNVTPATSERDNSSMFFV
jgi:hypothetical protein